MRGHSSVTLLEQLANTLRHAPITVATQIAANISLLLQDHIYNLSKVTHAKVQILYKEKIFRLIFPTLLLQFKTVESSDYQSVYLLAISQLLKYIPRSLFLSQVASVFPLMLKSLSSVDLSLRQSALESLAVVIDEVPDIVVQHISSVVTLLLNTAQMKEGSTQSRILALKCLS